MKGNAAGMVVGVCVGGGSSKAGVGAHTWAGRVVVCCHGAMHGHKLARKHKAGRWGGNNVQAAMYMVARQGRQAGRWQAEKCGRKGRQAAVKELLHCCSPPKPPHHHHFPHYPWWVVGGGGGR